MTSDLAEIDVQNKAKQKTGETAKEGRELLAKANEARVKEVRLCNFTFAKGDLYSAGTKNC